MKLEILVCEQDSKQNHSIYSRTAIITIIVTCSVATNQGGYYIKVAMAFKWQESLENHQQLSSQN